MRRCKLPISLSSSSEGPYLLTRFRKTGEDHVDRFPSLPCDTGRSHTTSHSEGTRCRSLELEGDRSHRARRTAALPRPRCLAWHPGMHSCKLTQLCQSVLSVNEGAYVGFVQAGLRSAKLRSLPGKLEAGIPCPLKEARSTKSCRVCRPQKLVRTFRSILLTSDRHRGSLKTRIAGNLGQGFGFTTRPT